MPKKKDTTPLLDQPLVPAKEFHVALKGAMRVPKSEVEESMERAKSERGQKKRES